MQLLYLRAKPSFNIERYTCVEITEKVALIWYIDPTKTNISRCFAVSINKSGAYDIVDNQRR